MRFTVCERCESSGRAANWFPTVPILADGEPDYTAKVFNGHDVSDVVSRERETCRACAGIKVNGQSYSRYRDKYDTYGEPYKSATSAKSAVTRGSANVCRACKGIGDVYRLTVVTACDGCHGRGSVVESFEPGDVLPDSVDLYDRMTGHAHWAATVSVIVNRPEGTELTWAAAHLGLGTIYSSQDYGRAAEADDATVVASVRAELARGHQWSHVTDKGSRIIALEILVTVTSNGYAVTSAASLDSASSVMLPPTYTADVLRDGPQAV